MAAKDWKSEEFPMDIIGAGQTGSRERPQAARM